MSGLSFNLIWQMSGEVIPMTLLNGSRALVGPTVGAGLVISLQKYLAVPDFPVLVFISIIFAVCVVLFRTGIVCEIIASATIRRFYVGRSGLNPCI
jgi:branched-chain amino acid transport system permease protein